MRPFSILFVLFALTALLLSGCGGGGGGSKTTSTSGGGTAGGLLVKKELGGVVSSANNKAVVVIPAHALAEDTRVLVAPFTGSLPAAPANKVIVGGTAFDLTPNSLAFSTPASVTIQYNPASLPPGVPESSLAIYTLASGAWQLVAGSTVDTGPHTVSVPLAHFSVYAVVAPAFVGSGPIYDVIDLGVLPGDAGSVPNGISSNGKVTGISTTADGILHAFLWSNGTMTNLGHRGNDIWAVGNGVNASGVAVGTSFPDSSNAFPVKFENGAVTQLGSDEGTATAINDQGDYIVSNTVVHNGNVTHFIGFAPATRSGALNNSADVAGSATIDAAIWRNGSAVDVGVLPGFDASTGTAISDNGKLVGTATTTSDTNPQGFIWESGVFTRIPNLTGDDITIPYGVNDSGQVVGTSSQGFVSVRGFLYQNGVSQDLNSLISRTTGWQVLHAYGINNQGQIIAYGVNGGVQRAILLNPKAHV
ncbi:HAF repeat-containing protein [Fimbriimonas ginsengisoli]|uniref:Integral membrane protein n=1 Tax=Fimbriimonas ginsengisoli Gsoil 348 TaxID=661478 RepID=A0A068NUS7_FIMGI|nr:HAF repeat-containing protein [Fimbriimonas ginsengisoli]AIE85364.1 integral membrane protein [Fimbriimonas ginsengisoli Gsoil 348]